MHGTFELTQLDARGLRDADFRAAARRGRTGDLLRDLPVVGRYEGRNLVFDMIPSFLFNRLMSGPAAKGPMIYESGSAALSAMSLLTTSAEPTYEEYTWEYGETLYTLQEHAGGGGKRFIEDVIETTLIQSNQAGREAVDCRSRWLFLPSEGVSSNIRSIGIYFARDGDYTGGNSERGRVARVRIKDAAGRPVIINKTSSQVLLIEYTFRLVSV